MSTFNIPDLSSDQAGSLAGTMNSSGYPFTMTPSGSGYNIDTNSEGAAYLGSAFPSGSQGTEGYGTLAGVFGNANTSNEGANSSATTGGTMPGSTNNNGDTTTPSNSKFSEFLHNFGADAAAIAIGAIVILAAVWRIV